PPNAPPPGHGTTVFGGKVAVTPAWITRASPHSLWPDPNVVLPDRNLRDVPYPWIALGEGEAAGGADPPALTVTVGALTPAAPSVLLSPSVNAPTLHPAAAPLSGVVMGNDPSPCCPVAQLYTIHVP